jgi:hypothetical protein
VTVDGTNIDFEDNEVEEFNGITEINNFRLSLIKLLPMLSVKADGISDRSSNTNWFKMTSNTRQHFVTARSRVSSISEVDMGTNVGERVTQ